MVGREGFVGLEILVVSVLLAGLVASVSLVSKNQNIQSWAREVEREVTRAVKKPEGARTERTEVVSNLPESKPIPKEDRRQEETSSPPVETIQSENKPECGVGQAWCDNGRQKMCVDGYWEPSGQKCGSQESTSGELGVVQNQDQAITEDRQKAITETRQTDRVKDDEAGSVQDTDDDPGGQSAVGQTTDSKIPAEDLKPESQPSTDLPTTTQDSLTSVCTEGQVVCIDGKGTVCVNGDWELSGKRCDTEFDGLVDAQALDQPAVADIDGRSEAVEQKAGGVIRECKVHGDCPVGIACFGLVCKPARYRYTGDNCEVDEFGEFESWELCNQRRLSLDLQEMYNSIGGIGPMYYYGRLGGYSINERGECVKQEYEASGELRPSWGVFYGKEDCEIQGKGRYWVKNESGICIQNHFPDRFGLFSLEDCVKSGGRRASMSEDKATKYSRLPESDLGAEVFTTAIIAPLLDSNMRYPSRDFFKPPLAGEPAEVGFTQAGIVTLNDRPFFPIGTYYLPGDINQANWEKLVRAGFNSMVWAQSAQVSQALEMAEKSGVFVAPYVDLAFTVYNPGGCPEFNRGSLQTYSESSALFAWYARDEPNPSMKEPFCDTFYDSLFSESDFPIWTNFSDSMKVEEYFVADSQLMYFGKYDKPRDFQEEWISRSNSSIRSFDSNYINYPVANLDYGSLIENYVQGVNGGENNAVFSVLSASYYPLSRPLNYNTIRYQALDSIAGGATGIYWWDWPPGCIPEGCPGFTPELTTGYSYYWQDLASVNSELNAIMPGLVGTTVYDNPDNESVSYQVKRGADGLTYVIASSFTGERSATIEGLPPNTRFEVSGEDRIVYSDSQGKIVDYFSKQQAHVYIEIPLETTMGNGLQ